MVANKFNGFETEKETNTFMLLTVFDFSRFLQNFRTKIILGFFFSFWFPTMVLAQNTGAINLNVLPEITDSGQLLTTSADAIFGNGTTTTSISHFSGEFIEKQHQWSLHANSDNTPVLNIGNGSFPTYIIDSYTNANWATGGKFHAASGEPILRFTNTNFRQSDNSWPSTFGGNKMDIIVEAYRSNFAFHSTAASVPFFGILGVFENSSIIGNNTTNSALFIGMPRSIKNTLIENWDLFKIEQGMGGMYANLKFENVTSIYNEGTAVAISLQYNAGRTDRIFHFLNCVIDRTTMRLSRGGGIQIWRSISAKILKSDATGLQNANLHMLYRSGTGTGSYTLWTEKYTRNANVELHEGALRIVPENTTGELPNNTGIRDWAYVAMIGEKWKISGFTNATNNGEFTVEGRDWGGEKYSDPYAFYFDGFTGATETVTSIDFEVLPPVSDTNGNFTDYKIPISYGRVDAFGSNGVTNAASRLFTEVLTGMNSFNNTDFIRNDWKAVIIPPYPYLIRSNNFTISGSADDPGDKVIWVTDGAVDANISETNSSTVENYTGIDTLDKFYDRAIWWKRQKANQLYPTPYEEVLSIDGNTIDLGNMDLIVDPNATNAFEVNTSSHTITTKTTTTTTIGVGNKFTSITTSGTISFVGSSTANFGYQDKNGKRKYLEVKGLTGSTVEVRDYSTSVTTPTIIARSTGVVSGTYRVSFDEPADPSNLVVAINRVGYTPAYQKFPETSLAYVTEPVLVPIVGLKENQELIIKYILKLLQKAEGLRNRYRDPIVTNPTMTVTTTANTATTNATIGNQEKVISLLYQILLRLAAIRQEVK